MKKNAAHRVDFQEEIEEWRKIEKLMARKGIPWWVDLRRAKISGENIFWRNDPKKEKIIRGTEKQLLFNLAVGDGKKKKILDIGCGSGWLSLELGREGMDVVGVDVSKERLKIARQYLRENSFKEKFGKVKYLEVDVNEVQFPKNSFDAIVVWDTLHHFPNLDSLLMKCRQWLVPGGRFIVYDHVGNKFLKTGRKLADYFVKPNKKTKIIPYEDTLGKKMIQQLRRNFREKIFFTRLSFPISILLYLFLSKDLFLPILPLVAKVDRFLCNNRLFYGEYFFFYGVKK